MLKSRVLSLLRETCTGLLGGGRCLRCYRECGSVPLCRECLASGALDFVPPGKNRCLLCGKPLVSEGGGNVSKCMGCRESSVFTCVDSVFPLYTYRLWKKALLYEWKMKGARSLTPLFAGKIWEALNLLFPGGEIPVVVPVPPRPGKIWSKGWDQVDELCTYLSKLHGVRIGKFLVRENTGQQKKLTRDERLGSGGATYAPHPKAVSVPEKVVLLDDVLTTGATVSSCAKVLRSMGCGKITVLSLFIVD